MLGKLLVVNKKNKILGSETKEKCHEGKGILHRAFSVLIFNSKNQLLLQKRSKFKLLWPLYWSNSCCSHPKKGEDIQEIAKKRLKEELGFTCPLELAGSFQYQARYKNIGSENELCSVFIGEYNGKIRPNSKEVVDWKWVSLSGLQRDIRKNPQKYTPWLKIILRKYTEKKNFSFKDSKGKKLNTILEKFAKLVEPILRKILISGVDQRYQQVIKYQVSAGGKRLRPALAITSCLMLGGKLKNVLYPAAGLEILHNYTLIIDDMIDNGSLRRGKPTTWFKFGESIAQCVGVDYAASIFQTAIRSKSPVLITELLAKTLKALAEGEILDVLFEHSGREDEPYVAKHRYKTISEKDYYEMIGKKTGVLFQTSCKIGGICAGAKEKELHTLGKYGFNLGMVFQITDDILDIFGQKQQLKKKIGKDIEEKKEGNIVILLTLKELNQADRNKFLKILRKDKIKKKDVEEVMKLIKKTNSHQKASLLGKHFAEKAKKSLESLPQNQWNEILRTLADFVLKRKK